MTGMKDMTRFFRSAVHASAKKYIVDATEFDFRVQQEIHACLAALEEAKEKR